MRTEDTFDRYIVSDDNRKAYEAAMAIAASASNIRAAVGDTFDHFSESDSKHTPSILVLCGASGVGKTHLLCAIENCILDNNPLITVHRTTSEALVCDMIQSLHDYTLDTFREKFRAIDVLLLDDIHFLAGKPSTQLELAALLDTLIHDKKHVVLTSSCDLTELENLDAKIQSHGDNAHIAWLHNPDANTGLAILRRTAKEKSFNVPDEVLQYLTTHVECNARQLKGALMQLYAIAKLNNSDISLEIVKRSI